MRITLAQPTETILREIAQAEMKRTDVAMTYAMCLTMADDYVDWPSINAAIIERWSRSGLEWVKREAWRLVERRER